MSGTRISDATSAGALTGAEEVPVARPPSSTPLRTTTALIAGLSAAVLVESGAARKTSANSAAAALDGTELVGITQGGATVRTTTALIAALGQWAAGVVTSLGTGLRLTAGELDAVVPLPQTASWVAGVDPGGVPMFIAPYACHVTGVKGRLETPEGAAATLRLVKAPSGTAISGGTNLTSDTMNANGTAATNQTLTLSVTPSDLVLALGDCIGIISTGTWTTSVGALTVVVNPGTA